MMIEKRLRPVSGFIVMTKNLFSSGGGVNYKIACDAHAKNIVVDRKAGLGSVKFEYQAGGETTSEA